MTADLLRRAADRIEELASKATPGPWHLDSHSELEKGCRCLSCWDKPWAYEVREIDGPDSPDGCFYNMHIGQDDATYIATLGPQIAAPLAEWLRNTAEWMDTDEPCPYVHAVALARLILGETK